jgi:glycosyltransferase involved in cell wall biosynthesis
MSNGAAMPRRALHVFATFGIGGPQMRQCELIARMGPEWRHDIVAMDGNFAASARAPKELLGELMGPPGGRGFASSVRAFVRMLRQRKPDLLLTYNWGSIEACAAARIVDVRNHVHHEEGFGPTEQTARHARRNWIRRLALARAHAVVVVSNGLLSIARNEWRVPLQKLMFLPNGVDLARFRPRDVVESTALRTCVVGAVGGLRAEKDHATLLRAFAKMRSDARLELTGDGPERAALEALARELRIDGRVQFCGSTDDTAASYRRMDVFALSSRTEQMPISMLEAMASGLPVASTDVGDVRAMLPVSARGALAPAGDDAQLARCLDALVEDPVRRAREGIANRAQALASHDADECLQRYVDLYMQAARPQR